MSGFRSAPLADVTVWMIVETHRCRRSFVSNNFVSNNNARHRSTFHNEVVVPSLSIV
jgi:hypothetical protein